MTVVSKTNALFRANQIRTEMGGGGNTPQRVGSLLVDMVDSTMFSPGATPDPVANTLAIQQAIDAAHAAYLAGAPGTTVQLPAGSIALGPSSFALPLFNGGVAVAPSTGCLVMRDGVTLQGEGIGKTILRPATPALTAIYMRDGSNQTITELAIDGQSPASLDAGHGILQVLSANDPTIFVTQTRVVSVFVIRVGLMGLGIQNGNLGRLLVRNFVASRTGAEGVRVQIRGSAQAANGIRLENIFVDTFGLQVADMAGIEVGGIATLAGVQVLDVGRAGVDQHGVRFSPRAPATSETWGRRCSLTGFYIRGVAATSSFGVTVSAPDVAISNGTIEKGFAGVRLVSAPDVVSGVHVSGVTTHGMQGAGFWVDDSAGIGTRNTFSNCTAEGGNIGFSDEGSFTNFTGCQSFNNTTDLDFTAAAVATQLLCGNSFGTSFVALVTSLGNGPSLEARGAAADIDLVLRPKGAARVKFGTRTASADAPVTGYIEILDAGGTVRRLAVIG